MIMASRVGFAEQIYQWRDAQGRAHYSDRGIAGAQRVSVEGFDFGSSAFGTGVVEKVFDGDTIQMSGGDKVRLLGINTPEVAGRNKDEEAGGAEAKAWLASRILGHKVRLETDAEERDHYHRRLAHAFMEDGTHLNLALVDEGLATVDIHPPNLKYLKALLAAERDAEKRKKGLWAMPAYQVRPVEDLSKQNLSGWLRVSARSYAVEQGRRDFRLLCSDGFEVRIPNANLGLFPALASYLNRPLEMRGWVRRRGNRFFMHLLHPSTLIPR